MDVAQLANRESVKSERDARIVDVHGGERRCGWFVGTRIAPYAVYEERKQRNYAPAAAPYQLNACYC
jgi:hypothetical protein